MHRQPPLRQVLFIGLLLCGAGWGGLYFLVNHTFPTLGPRWLFFFLLMIGVCGVAYPVTSFLHRRFPGKQPAEAGVALRQAILIGLYTNLLAWLQLGRVLDINRAIFLALGFIAFEVLLRLVERSRWKPEKDTDDE